MKSAIIGKLSGVAIYISSAFPQHDFNRTIQFAGSFNEPKVDQEGYVESFKTPPSDDRSEFLKEILSVLAPGEMVSFDSIKSLGIECRPDSIAGSPTLGFMCEKPKIGVRLYFETFRGRLYVAQIYLNPWQFQQLFPDFMVNIDSKEMSRADYEDIVDDSARTNVRRQCRSPHHCELWVWKRGSAGFSVVRQLATGRVYVFTYMSEAVLNGMSQPQLRKRIRI